MNKPLAYLFLIIFFCPLVCFGVNTKYNSIAAGINNQNLRDLKNFYPKQQYFGMEYGSYDPQDARDICNSFGIPREAIPLDAPSPIPRSSECKYDVKNGNISTQMAYGCLASSDGKSTSISNMIVRSTVRLSVPEWFLISEKYEDITCSGTIIGKQWVLTAAHCVAYTPVGGGVSLAGKFRPTLYQYPIKIYGSMDSRVYDTDAIYIPDDYAFYRSKKRTPYEGYLHEDFAILHLKTPFSEKYAPVELARDIPTKGSSVWNAGYGVSENTTTYTPLSYRNGIYMTNYYEGWWPKSPAYGNYGEIYNVDSPVINRNFAWSFSGSGDSGGPSFIEINKKLSLLGILSGGLFCGYAGFYAELPYPYTRYVSVPYYYDFINSVINGTVDKDKVRCISNEYGCSLKTAVYIANKDSQDIINYKVNKVAANLEFSSKIDTRPHTPLVLKLDPNKKHIYAVDSKNNRIMVFGINSANLVENLSSWTMTGLKPMDISFDKKVEYAYVPNEIENSISIYDVLYSGSLIPRSTYTDSHLHHPVSITTSKILFENSELLYVLNAADGNSADDGSIAVYKINHITHNLQFIAEYPTGAGAAQIIEDPSGQFVYILCSKDNTIWIYETTPTDFTHPLHYIQTVSTAPYRNPTKMAFVTLYSQSFVGTNQNVYAYVVFAGNNFLVRYKVGGDSIDSLLVSPVSIPTGNSPSDIDVDSINQFLYVTNAADHTVSQYRIKSYGSNLGKLAKINNFQTDYNPAAVIVNYNGFLAN